MGNGSEIYVGIGSVTGIDARDVENSPNTVQVLLSPNETATVAFDLTLLEGGDIGDQGTYSVIRDGDLGVVSGLDASAGTFTYTVSHSDYLSAPRNVDGNVDVLILASSDLSDSPTIITVQLRDDPCFLVNTGIRTPMGDVNVQDLAIGDLIETADGRTVAVKWVGHKTISTIFGAPERVRPVEIAANALGPNMPERDLWVTADHGLLIDGIICHAGSLVNGVTITRLPLAMLGAEFVVYHVETEAHEIILANGTPAETFIDNVSRRAFDNYAEFEALYGDVPEMQELDYPRAMSARQVPATIKETLVNEAAA